MARPTTQIKETLLLEFAAKGGNVFYCLNTGLYCETVMEKNGELLVPNALSEDDWKGDQGQSGNECSRN